MVLFCRSDFHVGIFINYVWIYNEVLPSLLSNQTWTKSSLFECSSCVESFSHEIACVKTNKNVHLDKCKFFLVFDF